LADTIQNKLAMLIKEPVVTVEIVNFQVNVLGEVNRPGTILVPNGKITILEAISQCGDLSINGLRDNVLIVRETDGKRQYGRVSLASNNIFLSPFYYLKQGDIVYVEMNRNKLLGSDQAHARRINYAALALTAVTAAAILYSVLKK
jgi:polysaccharide export outer membrane protein